MTRQLSTTMMGATHIWCPCLQNFRDFCSPNPLCCCHTNATHQYYRHVADFICECPQVAMMIALSFPSFLSERGCERARGASNPIQGETISRVSSPPKSSLFPLALCVLNKSHAVHGFWNIQGDPTQVTGLPRPLVLSYVDQFQNPFSHLTTTLGDLIEHIKHLGTCTITWETNLISFTLIYRFSSPPLSFPNIKLLNQVDFVKFWRLHSQMVLQTLNSTSAALKIYQNPLTSSLIKVI